MAYVPFVGYIERLVTLALVCTRVYAGFGKPFFPAQRAQTTSALRHYIVFCRY
jgi:hypothetical protein